MLVVEKHLYASTLTLFLNLECEILPYLLIYFFPEIIRKKGMCFCLTNLNRRNVNNTDYLPCVIKKDASLGLASVCYVLFEVCT